MKVKSIIVLGVTFAALSGCAHGVMRGSVAMKTSENEAHVCLGQGEVKPGDRVRAFRSVCPERSLRNGGGTITCHREEIGGGTVEQVLNEHYSVVKFDAGVPFTEGTFVEKK